VINIDPNLLPTAASSLGDIAMFATTLGHEAGHATQNFGLPIFTGINNYGAAVQVGDHAEGVALLQEYTVAQELTSALNMPVTMGSGQQVQTLIAQATQQDTPSSNQYNSDAWNAGAAWTATQMPSGTNITYNQYYTIQFLVQQQGGNAGLINWHNVSVINNPEDGSYSVSVTGIPATGIAGLFGGTVNLNTIVTVGQSGQQMLNGSFINGSTGNLTAQTVQTANADGTPQGTVLITAPTASTPATNVSVITASGTTTNYTMSGTPGVEDAMDAAATANSSGSNILIGGDGATLIGGSGQNLEIQFGNNGTLDSSDGAVTHMDVLGNIDVVNGERGSCTVVANGSLGIFFLGNNDTATVQGSNDTVTAGTGGTIAVDEIGATVNASSGDINFGTAASGTIVGNANTITGTANDTFTLSGNDNTLTLGADGYAAFASGSVGNVVADDVTGDAVNLYSNTSATIEGSGGYFGICGTNVWVNASDEWVNTVAGASFNLSGNSNVVTLGSDAYAALVSGSLGDYVTNDEAGDTVNLESNTSATIEGSGGYFGVIGTNVWVNASDEWVNTVAGAQFNLSGNSNVVALGSDAYAGLVSGSLGDYVTNDMAGDSVNLYSNTSATIGGSGGYFGVLGTNVWVNASDESVATTAGAQFTLSGNSNVVTLGASTTATIDGAGDTIDALGGSTVSLYDGWSTVNGSNITVNAEADGTEETVNGTGDDISGVAGADVLVNNTSAGTSVLDQFQPGNGEAEATISYYGLNGSGGESGYSFIYNAGNVETGLYNLSSTVAGIFSDWYPDGTPAWVVTNYTNDTSTLTEFTDGDLSSNTTWSNIGSYTSDGAGDYTPASQTPTNVTYNGSGFDYTATIQAFVVSIALDWLDDLLSFTWHFDFAAGPLATSTTATNVAEQEAQAQGNTVAAAVAQADFTDAFASAGQTNGATPSPLEGAKWVGTTITWSFADSPGPSIAPFSGYITGQYQSVVEQAMTAWAQASGLTLEEVPDSTSSDIRIGWGTFDAASSGVIGLTSLDGAGGVMQPGVIVRLEDPSEDALTAGTDGQLDYTGTQASLSQVALHEIGHALGLADSSDPNSVMYYAASSADATLDQTDISNIQGLYKPSFTPSDALLAHAMATFDPNAPPITTMPTYLAGATAAVLAPAH
jgi:uncharacterized protein YaiE (UPF0345 family)